MWALRSLRGQLSGFHVLICFLRCSGLSMFFGFSTGVSIFLVPSVKCFRFHDARSWPRCFGLGIGGLWIFCGVAPCGGGLAGCSSVGGILILGAGLGAGL